MVIGVLALQGDVAEHRDALADLGVDARPVSRSKDLAGLDGIVLPGGESTTMSMLLESSGLADPLGRALAGGLPAFGTCAGLILLAGSVIDGRRDQRCYGAIDLSVRRNGYGRQRSSFESDVPVPLVGPRPVHGVFIRAPLVERTGPEVEVLGALQRGTPGVSPGPTPVVCRQGGVLVSSFHPELTADRRLHRLFMSMVGGGPVPSVDGAAVSSGR